VVGGDVPLATREGKACRTVVPDAYIRRIPGWSTDSSQTAALVTWCTGDGRRLETADIGGDQGSRGDEPCDRGQAADRDTEFESSGG